MFVFLQVGAALALWLHCHCGLEEEEALVAVEAALGPGVDRVSGGCVGCDSVKRAPKLKTLYEQRMLFTDNPGCEVGASMVCVGVLPPR